MTHGRRLATAAVFVLAVCVGWSAPASGHGGEPEVTRCPVQLDVHRTAVAGTSIAWAELGRGDPLLLLNGTASPMAEWDPALLAALAASHQVIVMDYPGLGASGPAPGRWTFPAAADWIDALLARVVPGDRVDVLGWSMGGFIAQRLAVQHPDRVRRLVLAATNPGGPSARLGPPWVQEEDSAGDSLAAYLATNYPAEAVAAGRRFVAGVDACIATGTYGVDDVPTRTRRQMVAAEDPWLRDAVNVEELTRVTVPTLVVTGGLDVVTPPGNSRVLARTIPGARLVLVPGAGHSFLFQRPQAVARLIAGFLDDRTGAG